MSLRRSQDAAHNRRPARDVNVRRRVSGPFVKSRSVSRTPGGSAELPKREASQAQARPSSQRSVSGRDRSRDDSQKTRAALQKQSQSQSHSRSQSQQQRQPLKLDEQPKAAKIPNVFDFLQQENSSESGDSEDTDHSNDTNDPNELNDSNDSDDPDDSNASNYSNEVTLSQDDKASSIPLPQTEHIPSASHGERKRSTSLVTVNSHRDFETLQRAHSSSPNQVPSLISKTSSEISQPHTPLDMYSASGPLQFGSNALADREPSMTEPCTSAGAQSGISTPVEMPPLDMPYVPEAYYTSHQEAAPMRRMPTPPRSPVDHYHNYNYNHNHNHSNRGDRTLRRKPKQQQHLVPSGYGFLASRLSSSRDDNHAHIPPLYRRFENVNHRVLLYLQDEIAQMEEDLRVLDEYEEMHRVAVAEQEGTAVLPDSRRVDVQAQFHSPLHYRRLSLMEGLVYKTEQYSKYMLFRGGKRQFKTNQVDSNFRRQCTQRIQQSPPNSPTSFRRRRRHVSCVDERKASNRSSRSPLLKTHKGSCVTQHTSLSHHHTTSPNGRSRFRSRCRSNTCCATNSTTRTR